MQHKWMAAIKEHTSTQTKRFNTHSCRIHQHIVSHPIYAYLVFIGIYVRERYCDVTYGWRRCHVCPCVRADVLVCGFCLWYHTNGEKRQTQQPLNFSNQVIPVSKPPNDNYTIFFHFFESTIERNWWFQYNLNFFLSNKLLVFLISFQNLCFDWKCRKYRWFKFVRCATLQLIRYEFQCGLLSNFNVVNKFEIGCYVKPKKKIETSHSRADIVKLLYIKFKPNSKINSLKRCEKSTRGHSTKA